VHTGLMQALSTTLGETIWIGETAKWATIQPLMTCYVGNTWMFVFPRKVKYKNDLTYEVTRYFIQYKTILYTIQDDTLYNTGAAVVRGLRIRTRTTMTTTTPTFTTSRNRFYESSISARKRFW
jgi:hypothetical protein